MCRPSRWWLGLAPLAALFLVALFWKGPKVEADVAAHARAALAAQGVIDPAVAVEGRDARLAGLATGEAAAARAAALAATGVRKVADELKALPLAKPYDFSATRTPDGVTLAGATPGPAARAALLQAAAGLGKVKDEMRYAAGAPPAYAAMTGAALAALAPLSSGSATLSDASLSVAGQTPSAAAFDAAQAAVKALPAGMTLARFDVAAPDVAPYLFAARREGAGLALSGYAPDAATKARLLDEARRLAPQIEDRLRLAGGAPQGFEAMAKAALAALAPLPKGEATLTGASLALSGEAGDRMGLDAARAALAAPPAGMSVTKAEIAPPPLSPYPFAATRNGARLALTGAAPDAATRDRLVAAARSLAAGAQVEDALTLARGAGPQFEPQAMAALAALAPLAQGEAALADGAIRLTGVAPDAAARDKALAALKTAGLSVAAAEVTAREAAPAAPAPPLAQPFAFEARRAGDGAVTLSGHVPGEGSLALVSKLARDLGPTSGAPALASGLSPKINFDRLAELGFVMLNRLKSGWLRVGDDGLSLGGEASEAEAEAIRAALRRAGVTLGRIEIASPAAPVAPTPAAPAPAPVAQPAPAKPADPAAAACHGRILERLAEETIEFATGSARIAPKSEALVARLAEVIKGCPDADLEIAGHTDNVGDPERNLALSRERAAAVLRALVEAGAPAARLTSAGYGEAKPVAANDAAEGRARNRRIEFVLK